MRVRHRLPVPPGGLPSCFMAPAAYHTMETGTTNSSAGGELDRAYGWSASSVISCRLVTAPLRCNPSQPRQAHRMCGAYAHLLQRGRPPGGGCTRLARRRGMDENGQQARLNQHTGMLFRLFALMLRQWGRRKCGNQPAAANVKPSDLFPCPAAAASPGPPRVRLCRLIFNTHAYVRLAGGGAAGGVVPCECQMQPVSECPTAWSPPPPRLAVSYSAGYHSWSTLRTRL